MDRGYLRAALLGAGAALVLFLALATFGRGDLLHGDLLGGFYEAQALPFHFNERGRVHAWRASWAADLPAQPTAGTHRPKR